VTNFDEYAFSAVNTYITYLTGVYFQGNAPANTNVYVGEGGLGWSPTVYYLAGTTGWGTSFGGVPTQVWYPGELTMTLSPTNAILDGAEWQVDDGAWQTNGGMIDHLAYGNHTVSFKSIHGWRAADDQVVFMNTNFIITTAANSYSALPGGPSRPTLQVFYAFSNAVSNPDIGPSFGSFAPLIVCSNVLYGASLIGGISNQGSIFSIHTDGTSYSDICDFTNGGGCQALTLSGGVFYGTTGGSVFKVNLDGSGFATLCSGLEGADYGVVLCSNRLYGTTSNGGNSGNEGMIFGVNTDGTGFAVLHDFGSFVGDGVLPLAGLTLSGNTLYGNTQEGLDTYYGIIFAIQTDGTDYTNFPTRGGFVFTMALSGNVLYGSGFRVNTDGTGFTNIPVGGDAQAGVIVAGNTLYGTTMGGEGYSWNPGYYGSIYAVRTDGTGVTNLYYFAGGSDGSRPQSSLVLSGTSLFGTTPSAGANGAGTVFMLSFPPPQLNVTPSGTNVILTWPDGVHGAGYDLFSLQTATNLAASVGWTTLGTPPVSVNGSNTVTNPMPLVPTFYRLTK